MINQAYNLPFLSVGLDVQIWPLAKIINAEHISIGNSVIIDDFVFLYAVELMRIGSFVHIGSHTTISGGGEFIMEDFSGLSGGVRIYTANEDYLGGSLTNPAVPTPYRTAIRSFVHIQKHAIIGANSVVLPGVTIGEGAAIGANSTITKDVEPWVICAGSPLKIIRSRESKTILSLEKKLRLALYDQQGQYIAKLNRRS